MPPRLRRLSGDEVVKILGHFGFQPHSQKGSHIKLRRMTEGGFKQSLTIPRHHEMDRGTLKAIFRQASRFVDPGELESYFYSR